MKTYVHFNNILLTLLTPWSRVLLEKLTGSAASHEILRRARHQNGYNWYFLHGAESFLRSWLVLQLVKKFLAFYGTRKFITVLTNACYLSLSWAKSIQSPQPPPTSWRSVVTVDTQQKWVLQTSCVSSQLCYAIRNNETACLYKTLY